MDKNLMDALYVEHNGRIGVLSSDGRKVVSQIIGTDLTLVYDKKEGDTYLLIPLTKNHKFECKGSPSLWMASGSILTSFSASMVVNGFRCNLKKCYQW